MGSLSVWHWLIVLVIVVLVFGTGKLKNMGKDLGGAIKGFKEGMREADDKPADQTAAKEIPQQQTSPTRRRKSPRTRTRSTSKPRIRPTLLDPHGPDGPCGLPH